MVALPEGLATAPCRSSGALCTNVGDAAPGAGPSATRLDDAARSAKMLREQLTAVVN